jgi:hypothetical protein
MNLNDFELYIDDRILARGVAYYEDGAVMSLDFVGTKWVAEVSGSDDYTVNVFLSPSGDILESECDCPYDAGPICKHQVAVFHELRENSPEKIKQESLQRRANLHDILDGLDKATLVSVLLEYADADNSFKESLLFRFAEKPDAIAYAAKRIKASIRNVLSEGFVEYDSVRIAVQGALNVLQMISTNKDVFEAVELYRLVLREMVALEECCDDSNGYVSDVIARALERLSGITKNLPPEFLIEEKKEKLADLLISCSTDKIYGNRGEWMFSILSAVLPLCDVPAVRGKLEERLSDIISEQEIKPDAFNYTLYEAQNMRYHILCDFESEAAADEYLERYLSNPDFRRHAIEKAVSKNRLERALELCLAGEVQDKGLLGLVSQWKKYRYSVYEKQNNRAGQKELAFEFAMGGDFEYFLTLKNCYTTDEWPGELSNLLKFIKDNRIYRNDIYVKILIHEHLIADLLEYCKQSVSTITELYPHMVPHYADDVDSMFLAYINRKAESASSRTAYHEVCNIISKYKKACGKKRADHIIAELQTVHRRQRAFLDELARIG